MTLQTRLTHSTHQPHLPHLPHAAYLPSLIAVAATAVLLAVGIRWGTFAAGGSDSSCYLNQARLFRHGTTHIEQPLVTLAPWQRAEWTFTPAGHIPSPVRRDVLVPMCPPGLPLLMAGAGLIRGGEFLVVPLCGALAVWLTFVLGRRVGSAQIGAAAAVLVACSPSVLFQVVQPMTDVPAMAWWLLAALLAIGSRDGRGRPFAAGLAASMAVLIRPNLLPLAIILGAYVVVARGFQPRVGGPERAALLQFILGIVPGVVLLGILQTLMYGSPFATGYGAPQNLFHASHILQNLRRYAGWLVETHSSVLALAIGAPLVMRHRSEAWLGLGLAALTLALYLPYEVFDDWSYVRFLLPALPWLIMLSLIVIERVSRRFIPARAGAVLAGVVLAVGAFWITTARQRSAFELVRLERHFRDAGTFVAERRSDRTAILTVRHSGSVQYYSQRPTVSWDTLEPGSLDHALAFLRRQGLTPMLLLDTSEEPQFRARFEPESPIGRLDWPPIARIGRTIRVYDPADRARYFAGATIQTVDWPAPSR